MDTTITSLALTSDRIFFLTTSGSPLSTYNALRVFKKASAAPEVAFDAPTDSGMRLATDGSDVAFATYRPPTYAGTDEIWSCPAGVCANKILLANEKADLHLAVMAGDVYWIDAATRTLRKCATTGCAAAPTTVGPIAGPAFFVGASDASGLYVAATTGAIDRISLVDSARETLAHQPGVRTMTIDNEHIYWTTAFGLFGCKKIACVPALIAQRPNAAWLVGANGSLLWVEGKSVFRCTAEGCSAPTVVYGAHDPTIAIGPIALDAAFLYFAGVESNRAGSALRRVDR
ncbi:MAG TPA: hypothetical protein VLT33_07300 [Labilithrix sp.]|nr:hypothetical protein [Labilithrix sp.]